MRAARTVLPLVVAGMLVLGCRASPPAPATLRLLPLGDSITQGRGPGHKHTRIPTQSYRYPLFRALLARNVNVDFVGAQRGGFEDDPDWPNLGNRAFDRDHEARWGARLDEMLELLRRDLSRFDVDVALILLGGNDIDQGESLDAIAKEWDELIALLRAKNPQIGIALGIYCADWGDYPRYRESLYERARKDSTEASRILVADPCKDWISDPKLPQADTVDWVHPNQRGDQKIADAFLGALEILAPETRAKAH